MDAPEFKRGLFGNRGKNLQRMIEEREAASSSARVEALVADARVAEMERELKRCVKQQEQWAEDLLAAQRQADEARNRTEETRRRLEAALGELEQTRADLEGARSALADMGGELESAREALHAQAERSAAAEAMTTDLHADIRTSRTELDTARRELRAAAGRIEALTTELDQTRQTLRSVRSELADTRKELQARAARPAAPTPAPKVAGGPATADELAAALESTQRAIGMIVADARRNATDQLRPLEIEKQRLQRDIERMRAWLGRVEPLIAELKGSVADPSRPKAEADPASKIPVL